MLEVVSRGAQLGDRNLTGGGLTFRDCIGGGVSPSAAWSKMFRLRRRRWKKGLRRATAATGRAAPPWVVVVVSVWVGWGGEPTHLSLGVEGGHRHFIRAPNAADSNVHLYCLLMCKIQIRVHMRNPIPICDFVEDGEHVSHLLHEVVIPEPLHVCKTCFH